MKRRALALLALLHRTVRWLAVALALLVPIGARATPPLGSLTVPPTQVPDWSKVGVGNSNTVPTIPAFPGNASWPYINVTTGVETPSNTNLHTGSPNCGLMANSDTGSGNDGSQQTAFQCYGTAAASRFGDGRLGTCVYFPAGNYYFGNNNGNDVELGSNVVICGTGATTSVLHTWGRAGRANSAPIITFLGTQSGTTFAVTGGLTQGSTSITVTGTPGWSAGQRIQYKENADLTKQNHPINGNSNPSFWEAKVVSSVGSTVTIDRPLREAWAGGSPILQAFTGVVNSGVQNIGWIALDPRTRGQSTFNANVTGTFVDFEDSWDTWVVNSSMNDGCPADQTPATCGNGCGTEAMISSDAGTTNMTINGNAFIGTNTQSSPIESKAYSPFRTQDSVFENNYCSTLDICGDYANMDEGDVNAYNYYVNSAGLQFQRSPMIHAMWVVEMLVEGNTGEGNTVIDNFWGSNGPRNTFFRNEKVKSSVSRDGVAFDYEDLYSSTFQLATFPNIIANVFYNVLGRPGCSDALGTHCQPLLNGSQGSGAAPTGLWAEKNRFLGNWARSYGGSIAPAGSGTFVKSASDSGFCTSNDSLCQGFFGPSLSDANLSPFPQVLSTGYSGTSAPTQWASFTIPASFYYPAKPAWWNAAPWPAVGADITNTASLHKIPAQCRYEASTTGDCATGNPIISVVPTSLTASANCTSISPCGASPAAQTFNVTNSGGGSLTGTVSTSDATHCPISPTSFSNLSAGQAQPITVTYSTSALNAGTTSCNFTASATGLASQGVGSTITLLTPPVVSVSPATLSVSAPQGSSPGNSTITITNTGQSTLTNNITCSSLTPTFYGNNGGVNPIITIAQPISGGAATPVVLTYTTTTLTSGGSPYSDTITCSATGAGSATVGVTITITSVGTAPTYSLGPFGAGRTLVQGQSTSNLVFQTIITSGGSSQASLSLSSNASWLVPTADLHGSCTAGVCTTTIAAATPLFDRFTATINSAGLAVGTYTATITAVDNGSCLDTSGAASTCATQTTSVVLVVQAPPTAFFPGGFGGNTWGSVKQNSLPATLGTFQVCNNGFGSMNLSLTTSDALTSLSPTTVGPLTNTQCSTVTLSSLAGWAFKFPAQYGILITEQDNSSTPVPLLNPGQQTFFTGFITQAPVGLPR